MSSTAGLAADRGAARATRGSRSEGYLARVGEPIAGSCIVTIESRKQAARRPSPPFLRAGVRFLFEQIELVEVLLSGSSIYEGKSSRLVTLLVSARPIRNSIER